MRDKYTRTLEPARALAAETWTLERVPNAECGMRNAESFGLAYSMTSAEIALMWQTAPPRMLILQAAAAVRGLSEPA